MKINYEYKCKKEVRHFLNRALGFAIQKRKMKKNQMKRPKSLTQICITNYILCFLNFFVIYILFNFGQDDLATFFALLLIVVFAFNTILLLQYFYCCFKVRDTQGEIRFSEEGILDTSESGRVVSTPWSKVKSILIENNLICIFAKKTVYFFSNSATNEEVVKNAIRKYKPSIPIYRQELVEEHKFKTFFWNIGIYLLLFLFTFSFAIGFDLYNESILYNEIEKTIMNHEVDFQIYSHQQYGIVEKYVKEYYNEYYELENEYLSNNAEGTLELLKPEMFFDDSKDLDEFIKNLAIRQQRASDALDQMIAMFDKEKAMKLISGENLGEYYKDLYLDLLFTENDINYVHDLEEEKEINSEKMNGIKKLIQFLFYTKDDWFIDNDTLYFYHSENADAYNELYEFIMGKKQVDDSIFM